MSAEELKAKLPTMKVHELAVEIASDWKNMSPHALEYVKAMRSMGSFEDDYYYEPGKHIGNYFLANAGTWRGETARLVKAEIKKRCSYR